ncbi:hypothetical protein NQZ68_007063 [Dissostichus eleginoides]|nr:hypothetical protein NQZ68_007063 [Dissostichus eleginoides]
MESREGLSGWRCCPCWPLLPRLAPCEWPLKAPVHRVSVAAGASGPYTSSAAGQQSRDHFSICRLLQIQELSALHSQRLTTSPLSSLTQAGLALQGTVACGAHGKASDINTHHDR